MTSVLNRLPLLNGNNLLIFLLLIAGISSCSSKKITTSKKVEVVAIQQKTEISANSTIGKTTQLEDSIKRKPTAFDLDENINKINTKNTNTNNYVKSSNFDPNRIYNIAVILPFNLNQIPLGQYADDTTKQLSADTRSAVEFYLGCQMAREKFESKSLKTNVYFLDDRNDSLTATTLFGQKPFPNVDYMVGPLSFKNLKILSNYAKNTMTPLISPFANSMYIKDNPYLFNATASLKSQYSFILEQIKSRFPSKTLEVLYDSQDSTAENIELLKSISAKYYSYGTIKFSSTQSWTDAAKLISTTDTLSEKCILIYSTKDTYIKAIIAKLKPSKNKLHIFTSSASKNSKSLVDAKNPHQVYSIYPFNTDNPAFTVFAQQYEEKYKKKPDETAAQAYDIMMHLFTLLDKNQLLQDNTYTYSADFDKIQTKFRFQPVLNNNGNVDYFDNTFLYLYKYVNGNFVIATP